MSKEADDLESGKCLLPISLHLTIPSRPWGSTPVLLRLQVRSVHSPPPKLVRDHKECVNSPCPLWIVPSSYNFHFQVLINVSLKDIQNCIMLGILLPVAFYSGSYAIISVLLLLLIHQPETSCPWSIFIATLSAQLKFHGPSNNDSSSITLNSMLYFLSILHIWLNPNLVKLTCFFVLSSLEAA